MKHISDIGGQTLQEFNAYKEGRFPSYPTAWDNFNRVYRGGLPKKAIVVVGGWPKEGKSFFIDNLIFGVLDTNPDEDIVVNYFTYEMEATEIFHRLAARINPNMQHTINNSWLPEFRQDTSRWLKAAVQQYQGRKVFFFETPHTNGQYVETVTQQRAKYPQSHIINVLDHLRLVVDDAPGMLEERRIFQTMKDAIMLKKLDCTSIIASHLNEDVLARMSMDGRYREPAVNMLFGARAIAQTATQIILIERPELHDKKEVHIKKPMLLASGEKGVKETWVGVSTEGMLIARAVNRATGTSKLFFDFIPEKGLVRQRKLYKDA